MATADELRAMLAEAEARERDADKANRAAQQQAWRELAGNPENWEWSAIERTDRLFFSDEAVEGLYIAARIKPAVLDAWRAKGLSTFSVDAQEGRWLGCFYYRTNEGILTHRGGGHMILNDPMLCNDEEWAEMRAGRIPAKYQRINRFGG